METKKRTYYFVLTLSLMALVISCIFLCIIAIRSTGMKLFNLNNAEYLSWSIILYLLIIISIVISIWSIVAIKKHNKLLALRSQILLDTNKRLHEIKLYYPCASIFHKLPKSLSDYSLITGELKLLITKHNSYWLTKEQEIEAQQLKHKEAIVTARRVKENEVRIEKEKIKHDIQTIVEATNNGNIELAGKKIAKSELVLDTHTIDNEIAKIITKTKHDYKTKYAEGINDTYGIHFVDYQIPITFAQEDEWEYAVAKFPSKETVVFPFRRRAIARRGFMEDRFESYLKNILPRQLQVIGTCSILPADNHRPYEPDIAIIDPQRPTIRIDIEIDEPYAAISKKPIHYIGCGDDFRDLNLTNLGWIVIRFTEYQIVSDMNGCAGYVLQILHSINPTLSLPLTILQHSHPKPAKRWTEIEARIMAAENIREKYLNHSFITQSDPEELTIKDIKQTDIEKECSRYVQPISLPKKVAPCFSFEDDPIDGRDQDIQFSPYEHIYLYKGHQRLVPISSIVSYFFEPFNSEYWSSYKAKKRGIDQGEILEEWDIKGAKSRETGTYMHQQIEQYYHGGIYQKTYTFRYKGKYLDTVEEIRLDAEHKQFMDFINCHPFTPFRTEWAIYDENLKIAGTIDMICEQGGKFDIYDWKRSQRIIDSLGNPVSINSYGTHGIHGLENIHDTAYIHYCLQQNLYRYILEKNYGIKINNMFLIVFTDNAQSYYRIDVPRMDNEIKVIINTCIKQNITNCI